MGLRKIRWKRVWARSFDHMMGETDHDEPSVPILTQIEARLSLVIRTMWVLLHIVTCLAVIIGAIHQW